MNAIPHTRIALTVAIAVAAAGCASSGPLRPPAPLVAPVEKQSQNLRLDTSEAGGTRIELRRAETPEAPGQGPDNAGLRPGTRPDIPKSPLSTSIEDMPLPAFVNEVFGNQLRLAFQVDPEVGKRRDLVTLRVPQPIPGPDYYDLALDVLRSYGVAVRWQGDRLLIAPAESAQAEEAPIMVLGTAQPDVPDSHRPLFQLVYMKYVSAQHVSNWLRSAFKAGNVTIEDDVVRNALVLRGKAENVADVVAAIEVLDRPFMRGRFSARLEPAFVPAAELSRRLIDVMNAQGIAASTQVGAGSGTLLLPIESSNIVLVFAASKEALDYMVEWARTIDIPNPSGAQAGLFYYSMQNTRAADVVGVLSGLSPSQGRGTVPAAPNTAQESRPPAATREAGSSLTGGSLSVDEPRNSIIFRGDASEWQRLLPLIRQMDRPARQVLIEVTIAEVSLREGEEFGVAWNAKDAHGRFNGGIGFGGLSPSGTPAGEEAPASGSGLTYLLQYGGQARARLQAAASNSRLTVLSTPRLMVKSGQSANIEIGDDVPTLSAQTVSSQQSGGNSSLLQSVQYRKTGIILNVTPTVYSNDRVDLDISQEVSDVNPDAAVEGINSPAIFNRAVKTSLTLRDGSSILLGGLMSNRRSNSDSGVPGLKNVPVLGNLFKTQRQSLNRTELVLIITPYIVENDGRAQEITRALSQQLELIDLSTTPLPPDSGQ